jgi:hypothetical protein
MKYISIVGFLVSLTCCQSPSKKVAQTERFAFYQSDTIKQLLKQVVRTDSTATSCYLTFSSFDKNDSLVIQLKYYQCQNNSKGEYLTRCVYDLQRKLILEETFNMEGNRLKEKHY